MLSNVNATRMELLQLRRRVALAGRGHRLLSEKRDEISRQLMLVSGQIKPLRREVENQLLETCRRFMLARASMEPEDVKAALEIPTRKFSLAVSLARVMNVQVPELSRQMKGELFCYGFSSTSGEMDVALMSLEKAIDNLTSLAQKEKQARLLSNELARTRRRVNVLEHVVIPEMQATIKYINSKLSEAERDNTTRLMKIADIIRA